MKNKTFKLVILFLLITLFSFSMLYSCGETTDNEYDDIVIELEDSLAYVEVGGTFKINYLATNSEGKTAKWKSDDNSICTVAGGVVLGLKEGTTKVIKRRISKRYKEIWYLD